MTVVYGKAAWTQVFLKLLDPRPIVPSHLWLGWLVGRCIQTLIAWCWRDKCCDRKRPWESLVPSDDRVLLRMVRQSPSA
jgi:hypothetical protein